MDMGGQNPVVLPEYIAEIGMIGKAAKDRHLFDTVEPGFQQPPGMGAPDGIEIVIGGLAGDPLEFPLKMELAQSGAGGDVIACDPLWEVGLHINQSPVDPFQRIGIGRLGLPGGAVMAAQVQQK